MVLLKIPDTAALVRLEAELAWDDACSAGLVYRSEERAQRARHRLIELLEALDEPYETPTLHPVSPGRRGATFFNTYAGQVYWFEVAPPELQPS
jgi:hypothetical protein